MDVYAADSALCHSYPLILNMEFVACLVVLTVLDNRKATLASELLLSRVKTVPKEIRNLSISVLFFLVRVRS